MGIVRALYALLGIAIVVLAGCQTTGTNWAFWKSNKDNAPTAKSDFPVPPSKTATPTINSPAARTAATTPNSSLPTTGGSLSKSPASSTAGLTSGNSGATAASFTSPTNSAASLGTPSVASRSGSVTAGAGGDPFLGPQQGRYSSNLRPDATARTSVPPSNYSTAGTGYPQNSSVGGGLASSTSSPYRSSLGSAPSNGTSASAIGASSPSRFGPASDRYGSTSTTASYTGAPTAATNDRFSNPTDRFGAADRTSQATSDRYGAASNRYDSSSSSGRYLNPATSRSSSIGSTRGDTGPLASAAPSYGNSSGGSLYQPFRARTANDPSSGFGGTSSAGQNGSGAGLNSAADGRYDAYPSSPSNSPFGRQATSATARGDDGRTGSAPGDYTPGNTGYNPPSSRYQPGNTGYQAPTSSSYRTQPTSPYPTTPAGEEDPGGYRPGNTGDYYPSRTTNPSNSFGGLPSANPYTARRDADIAPVSYDAQPGTTAVRR